MVLEQFFPEFQLFAPEVEHLYHKNTWKNSQMHIQLLKIFKTWNISGKEFASERMQQPTSLKQFIACIAP